MSFPYSIHFILTFATTILGCLLLFSQGNNETDRLALLDIKDRITLDPFGIMRSWNHSIHFCQWHGVTCGHRHLRVRELHLHSSKLIGTISPFLGNLSFLRVLSLYNNSLNGVIPPNIFNLHHLRHLRLNNNSLEGEIPPNISARSHLVELDFHDNRLMGTIPLRIGSLFDLKYLSLSHNNLEGTIPSSIANLSSLLELHIYENKLIGSVPSSLGNLKNLMMFSIYENNLSGMLPLSIFNLSSLMALDLGLNCLEGSLPTNFGMLLPKLRFFSVARNRFSGSIPISISNSSYLVQLELSCNNLQGQVPNLAMLKSLEKFLVDHNSLGTSKTNDLNFVSSLANATKLDQIGISFNNFRGILPSIICNFSMLSFLDIGLNNISGQIPTCIENLASLQVFAVEYNQLFGSIPSCIGKLNGLRFLSLSGNQLSGYIPSSIGNLTKLGQLYLNENNFIGNIPLTLGNSRYLLEIDLSQNDLSGMIPVQLFSLSSITSLTLSNNLLNGSLPQEVGKLKNMGFLHVSNTRLTGEIPSTLGACISLEYLHIGGNTLHGPIPPTLTALRGLRVLDLSCNNLSGKIPNFLAIFALQMLNLSYNHFDGEVPVGGIFSNKTGLSIFGNNGLCGGMVELNLPSCNFNKIHKKRMLLEWRLIIAIILGVVGVLVFVAFVTLFAYCYKRKRKDLATKLEVNSLPNLSYQTLFKATSGFSPDNVIGDGTFGVVYKGSLDEDQNIVAIKVFNLEQMGAAKSFVAECEVLKNVKHRNLVKVITACSSIDHRGHDFKALVYEYMVNGSLEDWLYQKATNGVDGPSDAPKHISLLERLDVSIDVAFALGYLHHHCGISIVHCDLKPSNILFDNEMVAHVGDFGLAKFVSNDIITNSHHSSSIGVRGTVGYAPPEYGMGNEPSIWGDVYSFGILLLEMLTGRRPTDSNFKEGLNLHDFVKASFPKHVMEILDEALRKEIVGEVPITRDHAALWSKRGNNMVILEALTSVLGIALSCSSELPQERLDMNDVAAKLSSVRNKLTRTNLQR